jgi:hypothetical protein
VAIPHWVATYQAAREKVKDLEAALAAAEEAKKKLRDTIDTKNFEVNA